MNVTKISDPDVFLSRAAGSVVTVCLTGVVIPEVRSQGKVWMVPALQLHYSVTFTDTVHYEYVGRAHTWTFMEQRTALPGHLHPEVDLIGTLLEYMQADPATYTLKWEIRAGCIQP